ncbi:hypothetical protein LNM67_25665, partial [Klebsiella pneumoniae]|nr:hypothetical protein [Klebsiella pneumoniae]
MSEPMVIRFQAMALNSETQIASLLRMAKAIAVKLDLKDVDGVVSENGIYGHSRFCNTDFDDKLACLNLSG